MQGSVEVTHLKMIYLTLRSCNIPFLHWCFTKTVIILLAITKRQNLNDLCFTCGSGFVVWEDRVVPLVDWQHLFSVDHSQKSASRPVLVKQYPVVITAFTLPYATCGVSWGCSLDNPSDTERYDLFLLATAWAEITLLLSISIAFISCCLLVFFLTTGGQHLYRKESWTISPVHTSVFPKLLYVLLQFRYRISSHTTTNEINELNVCLV